MRGTTGIWHSILGLALMSLVSMGFAQAPSSGEDSDEKSFADLIKDTTHMAGFFDVYRSTDSGDLYLSVDPGRLNEAFIYAAFVVDSPVESGLYRGANIQKMLRVERHFDRLEFINESTAYYHDPKSPLARAARAHATASVLAVAEILAEDEETGALLIDGKKMFLSEALQQIKPTPSPDFDPKQAFALGELDGDRSKIYESRSYPQNTDWFVDYVYANPAPAVAANDEVADSRYVSVRMQHSFIEAPSDGFEPRFDDYRVGFFTSRITDLTSTGYAPYRDVISRWHLTKADPSAAVSDVVEPIVWWIENTTPLEWRELIKEATLAWNPVFEKAGFRNAIEVRVQPDDADWDAGDIRYNVLRWASSPQPPYGGIGPSFVDPRTGQILGSDIGLEYTYVRRHLRWLELYDPTTMADALAPRPTLNPHDHVCELGASLPIQLMLGQTILDMQQAPAELYDQIVRDVLFSLVLHEVGHTLGLMHNMKATQLLSLDALNDPAVRETGLLDASIMDYAPAHFAATADEQQLFYSIRPGAYDEWAIKFGYSTDMDDPAAREAHLAQSTRPELMFGNDADDMRSPGRGIDPRINIYDLSNDAVGYAARRFDILKAALRGLDDRLDPGDDTSYQKIVTLFTGAGIDYRRAAGVVSRYIGGVHVNRAAPGQDGAEPPYVAVPLAEQQRAMGVLREHVFAPDVMALDDTAIGRLQPQRRSFDFWQKTEDPKVHDFVLAMHNSVLDHLLHPVVLKRMTDARLYGNEYTVTAMASDLTDAIFADDLKGNVRTVRQNLQLEYVDRLLKIVESGQGNGPSPYDVPSRAAALKELREIDRMMGSARRSDAETAAHRELIQYQIRYGLDRQDG